MRVHITKSSGGVQKLADKQLRKLVASLNSLHQGGADIPLLMICGERAIRPLRDILLHGLYGDVGSLSIPLPQVVWALAELGARDVLLEYLAMEKDIADPVVCQAEDTVENTAARALAAWHSEDVSSALLKKLSARPLAGVIETLGNFRRPEPLPHYILSLEDDSCRHSAEEAIAKLGEQAHAALIKAAGTPHPSATAETPSSVCRRRSALRLLSDLRLSPPDWQELAPALHDRDPEISVRAGFFALLAADPEDKDCALRRLLEVLPEANHSLQREIESRLLRHFASDQDARAEEIARRPLPAKEKSSRD
jgi:hypothetical protein